MRPVVVSKNGSTTGATAWVPLDFTQNILNVGIGVTISATATFGVEVTYDDIFDPTATPVAMPFADIPAGTVANIHKALNIPVRAVRLNVAASTGGVKMTVVQGLAGG